MRAHKLVSKVHKWVGLLVGVQFLLWTAGGVVMTWIPIETVRGEHNIAERVPASAPTERLAEIFSTAGPSSIRSLQVRRLADKSVLELKDSNGNTSLLAADTGAAVVIDAPLAQAIAQQDFAGATGTITAQLLDQAPADFRGKLPVWQVAMGDADGTLIYVSPDSGRVLARRNDTWRFYDFFWMLHIMDYDTRDNFNNPLVMTAGATGLIFVLSGLILVFYRFGRRDFGLAKKR